MRLALTLMVSFALLVGGTPARSLVLQPVAFVENEQAESSSVAEERGVVALDQSLREITNPFTVVCIAARPGDQDDGTLCYIHKRLGARVVIVFATRGEGEDSPTRRELDQKLAAIHTREAIEAARVIGADLFFLNLRDIGYSKSADGALSVWGHDEARQRMVRAFRLLRPDVIITSHDPKTGEGVEQATARLALEAFKAAGDAKLAPEAGSEAWQPRRFLGRTDSAGAEVTIDLNVYDHLRGKTYAQIGLAAHRQFISRGANLDRLTPERETSYYRLIASTSEETIARGAGLFDGLTLSENLSRSIAQPRVGDMGIVAAIASGERLVDALIEKLIEKRAEGSAETLHERYGSQFVRVVRFTSAIERAIALALGLNLEVTGSDSVVVPGQKLVARLALRNGSPRTFPMVFSAPERLPATEKNPAYKDTEVFGIGTGRVAVQEFEYEIAKDAALTLPHSAHLYDEEYYSAGSSLPGAQTGEPFGNRLLVTADVALGQVNIRLAALARFDVASPVEISTVPFALVKDWSKPREIAVPVRLRNRTPGALAGAVWVVPLALTEDEYEPLHVAFAREDEEIVIMLKLRLPILKPPLAPDVLIEFRREKPAPPDPLGSTRIAVKTIDFEIAEELKVGYIQGPDDWLLFVLNQLVVEHSELTVADITVTEHGNAASGAQSRIGCGDLGRFNTIIVDRNAYFAHPELVLHNRCLLRYVRQGGNLIVLDQRPDDWNLILSNSQFAPYSIKLSKDRLTMENARVKILDPEHAMVSKPNKLSSKDFEGWLVERAANVPREWATEFIPLLESTDPGEEPTRGSLLVARYGEGTYVYSSLSLRRQLLASNAGAYRVFANLVSFPKTAKVSKPQ